MNKINKMIFTIIDYKVKSIAPQVWQFNYYKGKKLNFNETLFQLSNITIQHVYIGF